MSRSRLVDEVARLRLNRLEVLAGADRGELAIWILPAKVREAVVTWSMCATGSDAERGEWRKERSLCTTGPEKHHRPLFGPRHNRIPSDPDFLRVDGLADGESFRDLEAGRTLTAKAFSATLNPPVEEEGIAFTELKGATLHGTAATLALEDLYVDSLVSDRTQGERDNGARRGAELSKRIGAGGLDEAVSEPILITVAAELIGKPLDWILRQLDAGTMRAALRHSPDDIEVIDRANVRASYQKLLGKGRVTRVTSPRPRTLVDSALNLPRGDLITREFVEAPEIEVIARNGREQVKIDDLYLLAEDVERLRALPSENVAEGTTSRHTLLRVIGALSKLLGKTDESFGTEEDPIARAIARDAASLVPGGSPAEATIEDKINEGLKALLGEGRPKTNAVGRMKPRKPGRKAAEKP